MTTANRGKKAEKDVRTILTDIEKYDMDFTFNRNLDAHAAGGRFPAQTGDFQAFRAGHYVIGKSDDGIDVYWVPGLGDGPPGNRNFIVEVKEVKHDFRLPHANYSADKVARVEKRVRAGTEAIVMVLHTTTGLWRAVPHAVFTEHVGGSWDLRAWPIVSPDEALKTFFGYD